MAKTYTLPELLALDSDTLNKMAAELRGYRLVTEYDYNQRDCYLDDKGDCLYRVEDYSPATDRNQSGELLDYAEGQGLGFMIDKRSKYIPARTVCYGADAKWLLHVPGNDARAETVAFCAAMLAMQGRLSDG
jgi:hypothetical protein